VSQQRRLTDVLVEAKPPATSWPLAA